GIRDPLVTGVQTCALPISGSCRMTPASGVPRRFLPLQRAQIVALACLEPIAEGLHITHWTSQDLVHQAMADGIVKHISPRTVWQIGRASCRAQVQSAHARL